MGVTNRDRAERASWLLEQYADRTGLDLEDDGAATIATDLITDLMHLADECELDWSAILATANLHHEAERPAPLPRLCVTVLRPQDCGEWGWTEAVTWDGCHSYEDYEREAFTPGTTSAITTELDGWIHDQQGRVYKHVRNGETRYEMVWLDNA